MIIILITVGCTVYQFISPKSFSPGLEFVRRSGKKLLVLHSLLYLYNKRASEDDHLVFFRV